MQRVPGQPFTVLWDRSQVPPSAAWHCERTVPEAPEGAARSRLLCATRWKCDRYVDMTKVTWSFGLGAYSGVSSQFIGFGTPDTLAADVSGRTGQMDTGVSAHPDHPEPSDRCHAAHLERHPKRRP